MNNLPVSTSRLIGVYCIRNMNDHQLYVGSSIDIRGRFYKHLSGLKRGRHHCGHLQRAWAKHGEQAFQFELIELCSAENVLEREQFHMDANQSQLYNSAPEAGSTNGRKRTPEECARISAAQKGLQAKEENPFWGRSWSEPALEESLRVMKTKLRERFLGERNPFYGRQHSEETCKKLSALLTGRSCPHTADSNRRRYYKGKAYLVVSPNGEQRIIFNMTRYCKATKEFIQTNVVTAATKGTRYKGFAFKVVTVEEAERLHSEQGIVQIDGGSLPLRS